jgi:hypothetical protein
LKKKTAPTVSLNLPQSIRDAKSSHPTRKYTRASSAPNHPTSLLSRVLESLWAFSPRWWWRQCPRRNGKKKLSLTLSGSPGCTCGVAPLNFRGGPCAAILVGGLAPMAPTCIRPGRLDGWLVRVARRRETGRWRRKG